jgi:hypothetical protein
MDFGPGTELKARTKPAAGSLETQDLHLAAGGTPLQPPPSIGSDTDVASTVWVLVQRAAWHCENVSGSTIGRSGGTMVPIGVAPWEPSIAGNEKWYIYEKGDNSYPGVQDASCAERLQYEENLLCIADQLGAIADAVGTTVWPALPGEASVCANVGPFDYSSDAGSLLNDPTAGPCYEAGQWEIPPQADSDRFIVRDLAIHTLGMLATLDATPVAGCPTNANGGTGPCTCTSLFGDIAEAGSTNGANTTPVTPVPITVDPPGLSGPQWAYLAFGTGWSSSCQPGMNPCYPLYPPSDVPIWGPLGDSNAPTIARSALQIEAQVLRSGGRLLHDLVRRDVYSDLAAAAKKSAHALDPQHGNEVAWGIGTEDRYGSYAHAARVLAGRWEIGDTPSAFNYHGDPACEGALALDIVPSTFGDELSARVQDRGIRTKGEALAADIVGGAGIVLPGCTLSQTSPDSLRGALVDQLVLAEQRSNGLASSPPSDPFARTVAKLADAEVLFGFNYALRTYRLLTDSADVAPGAPCTPLPTGVAGLKGVDASAVASSVTQLNGIVIAGGLPRSRLLTEPIARAGGLLEASVCPNNWDGWTEWGTTSYVPTPSSAPIPTEVFQDSFHMGQAFERRLVELQIASTPVAGSDAGDPQSVAKGAIAELRSWAGSMMVQSFVQYNQAGMLAVRISGEDFADLGLAGPSDPTLQDTVESAFGFVYGPPWMAECAAHVRADCPAGFDPWTPASGPSNPNRLSGWVQHPTAVAVDAPDATGLVDVNYLYGAVPPVFTLTVPYASSDTGISANFNPPNTTFDPPGNQHLYMVRIQHPKDPGGRGQVLGVVRLLFPLDIGPRQGPIPVTSFVVSPMQRELLEDTIDLGKWEGARPPAIGDLTAADSPGYCVDGVSRDVFVPLQNQLSSGDVSQSFENSWQYYLNAAKQAASTADGLAQQLLALDLQVAQNEQAAGEQVASLCGDYGALSQVSIDPNGHVSPDPSDKTLNQCLNPPMTDVVFLSSVPDALLHGGNPPAPDTPAVATSTDLQWIQNNVLHCSAGNTDPLCKSSVTQIKYNSLGIVPPRPAGIGTACQKLQAVEESRTTSFQGTQFLSILQDPTFTTSAMQALAVSLKMNVTLFDDWSVAYGGMKIMDTAPGNPAMWPGCLKTGCDANNKVVKMLNTTFRYCPVVSPGPSYAGNLLNAPLGCDGSTSPSVGADVAELNVLRWRVGGALQMIAASAGFMPQQMFTMPVPVVLVPYPFGSGANGAANASGTFIGAAYGGTPGAAGWLGASGSQQEGAVVLNAWKAGTAYPAGTTGSDQLALGTVYDIAPAFTAFTNSATNEIPAWYVGMYDPSTVNNQAAKHAWTGNAEMAWTNCVPGQCPSNPAPNPWPLAQVVGATGTTSVDGVQCPLRWGLTIHDYSGPQPVFMPGSLVGNVALLKTGYDASWALPVPNAPTSLFGDCGLPGPSPDVSSVGCMGWPLAGAEPLWQGSQGSAGWQMGGVNCPLAGSPSGNAGGYCVGGAEFTADQLPPARRVFAFVNLVGENGGCNAIAQLLDATAVACTTQAVALQGAGVITPAPPQVASMTDIIALQAWLAELGQVVGVTAANLYTEHVPDSVVSDLRGGSPGGVNKSGQVGVDTLAIEQSLQDIPSAWARIAADINSVNSAIQSARIAIQIAGLKDKDALQKLAFQDIQIHSQMMQSVSSMIMSVINWVAEAAAVAASGGAGAAALVPATIGTVGSLGSGGMTLDTSQQELANISDQVKTTNELQAAEVGQALTTLNSATSPMWADIQTSLDNLRKAVLGSMQASSQLQQAQGQASYQAAIAAGNDTVVIAGQEVPIPVNTVLNRQLSATAIRYQRALKDAKTLSYMARRAIEQRIGIPLNAISTPVGALEPPASWADDVCSLTGINYQAMATPTGADAGGQNGVTEQQFITQFADSFVGDYVTKLQNFVTYFNVQYPSHEGNDTAVLSLRYDLMNAVPQCSSTAPNLLHYSGDLSHQTGANGWQQSPCDPSSGRCLVAIMGAILQRPDGPAGAHQTPADGTTAFFSDVANGVTWLMDVPQSGSVGGDAGTAGGGTAGDAGGATTSGPPGLVYQPVSLGVGSYVLSWWDQARDSSGNLLTAGGAPPTPYVVHVYDSSWHELATNLSAPFVAASATDATIWSQRLTLPFQATQAGTYYVAFGASTQDEALGSVAIADVQLEPSTGSGIPSIYVQTGDTRTVTSFNCTPSDSDMRAAFQHSCDDGGTCWYDLTTPLVLDTQQLQNGNSPISGKLAPGNFNFRHVDLAVNLVGTGVHDCSNSPTPDCYGSAYIQYTLTHDGTSAGILDWNGNSRDFDFGVASINSGKALAAERYITLPISSADQALLGQSGIQHIELRGRPLDGGYTLRIWDSPSLRWDHLQDVQIVLDYLYWSEIIANGNAQAGQ